MFQLSRFAELFQSTDLLTSRASSVDLRTGCLQLLEILEISWNFIDAPGKFNCQLKYDNIPITEPSLVTSLTRETAI